ncbi:MAG: hypothetical protein Q9166_003919 [cf. Caloplaca sp. 2 TL-2023]
MRPIDRSPDCLELVVLDDFTPSFSLNITYPSSHKSVKQGNNFKPSEVSSSPDVLGNRLKDSAVASAPEIYINAIGDNDDSTPTPTIGGNTTYTLALTDPDATSRSDPKMAEMCHWLLTGISSGKDSLLHVVHLPAEIHGMVPNSQIDMLETQDIVASSKPTELMSYYPPAPPPKTGYHRYVFVLLAPKANSGGAREDAGLKKPKERPHWGYGKIGKGVRDWAEENGLTPVGANFFYAKNQKQ